MSVAAVSGDCFVVTGSVPGAGGGATPVVLEYRPRRAFHPEHGEFELTRCIEGAASPVALHGGRYAALHAHPGTGRQVCVFGPGPADHRPAGALPGCAELVADASSGLIAGLAPRSVDPFTAASATDISASRARRGIAGWRLAVLATGSSAITLFDIGDPSQPDIRLTGELGTPAGGVLSVGVARDHPDGRRQLGLCLVRMSDGEVAGWWWHPDYDLHSALPDEHGRVWALRASTRHHDADDPLRHELWRCDSGAGIASRIVLDDGRQVWRTPVGWAGDRPLALHLREGRRRLEQYDAGAWCAAVAEETHRFSVSSVGVFPQSVVTVESSLVSPPALWWRPLLAAATGAAPGAAAEATAEAAAGAAAGTGTGAAARPAWRVDRGAQPPVRATAAARTHRVRAAGRTHRTASVTVLPPSGRPRSVVALFHGGPTMSWSDWSWRWNPLPFVAEGHAVVLVDPAGSDGYGEPARTVAWRNWRPGIVPSAVATLAAARGRHGLAGLPLSTMGGSFGGYLAVAVAGLLETTLVAAHATPFAPSAVSLASDAYWSWAREWGPLRAGAADLRHDDLELAQLRAPTQVLLSHGMADDQVPYQQSVSAARSLRLGGVGCELALLPGVGHPIGQPGLIGRWYQWVLAGLDSALAAQAALVADAA
jgi:dipeptidyl aminopeptidase/acylaminoacyl peptidase